MTYITTNKVYYIHLWLVCTCHRKLRSTSQNVWKQFFLCYTIFFIRFLMKLRQKVSYYGTDKVLHFMYWQSLIFYVLIYFVLCFIASNFCILFLDACYIWIICWWNVTCRTINRSTTWSLCCFMLFCVVLCCFMVFIWYRIFVLCVLFAWRNNCFVV